MFKNVGIKISPEFNNTKISPIFENKAINEFEHQAGKLSLQSEDCSTYYDSDNSKSFLRFYNSIPDYGDMQHLSNKDFYENLENLRQKQIDIYNILRLEVNWKSKSVGCCNNNKTVKSNFKTFGNNQNKSPCMEFKGTESDAYMHQNMKAIHRPSKKSVQIDHPKLLDFNEASPLKCYPCQCTGTKSIGSCNGSIVDDLTSEDLRILNSEREFDSIRNRSHSANKITPNIVLKHSLKAATKPFQMELRNKANEITNKVQTSRCNSSPKEEKHIFKDNPITMQSQFDQYEKTSTKKDNRTKSYKKNRKAALLPKLRALSFAKLEKGIQEMKQHFTELYPSSFENALPRKVKHFKVKPAPKDLFSNYIYKKLYEDEFYRAIKKRVRAEEMLKTSSLPPSMAKRNKDCSLLGNDVGKPTINNRFEDSFKLDQIVFNESKEKLLENEFEEVKIDDINEISSNTLKNRKLKQIKTSKTKNSILPILSVPVDGTHRSNLAAFLRIHSAKKRKEDELANNLESSRIREEARWREHLIKQKSGWKILAFNHAEDMAIRLQLRKDEERLRSEKHQIRMCTMLERVNLQPFLFERSHIKKQHNHREKAPYELNSYSVNGDEYSASPPNGLRCT